MVKFLHIEHIDYISKACKHFWVLGILYDVDNNYVLMAYLLIPLISQNVVSQSSSVNNNLVRVKLVNS